MRTTIIIILTLSLQANATVRGDVLRAIDNDHVAKFLNACWSDAEQVSKEFDIPIGLLLALSAAKSDFGRSRLAKENNNYFKIKYEGGYAAFGIRLECFRVLARTLSQGCYKELPMTSLNICLYLLESCGYRLSKAYSRKIRSIYYRFGLDRCDNWNK